MVAVSPLILLFPSMLASITKTGNYEIFPDENGVPNIINLDVKPLTTVQLAKLQEDLKTITYRLHTRANVNGELLEMGNIDRLKSTTWNPKNPTRFVTHGWQGSESSASCTSIRNAYLEVGGYNVIVLDWSKISSSFNYGAIANSMPIVADHVALFIDFLNVHGGLDPAKTKLVGHSLGGHLAGLTARAASERMEEVVALDPARPYFHGLGPGLRVDASDAKIVQIIHTCAGRLGMENAVGTSDFYPNGGRTQPGCSAIDIIGTCAHSRAHELYAESIKNPTGFKGTATSNPMIIQTYSNTAYMGGPKLDHNASGSYTLQTASTSPYALG